MSLVEELGGGRLYAPATSALLIFEPSTA